MVLAALAVQALLLAQVPPYATPAHEQTLRGTIAGFDGKYHLRLRDERGWFDDVTLHQGTIISPVGLRLQPGMRVTIRGAADGATFDADEVDAPDESAPETPYDLQYGTVGTWSSAPYGWNTMLYSPYGGYYYPPYGIYGPQIYVIPVPVVGATPAPPHRSYRRPLTAPPPQAIPPRPAPPPPRPAPPPRPVSRPPASSRTHR